MSVQSLVPTNSKLAGDVAVKAFLKFLDAESVSKDSINVSILADPSGNTFPAIMDKFAMQTKKWLLGLFNSQKEAVNEKLLKMAQTLDKFCLKRDQGGIVKKAPACTKSDLHLLMSYFYKHATSGTDYQDAALVYLMWFVFGRASDLSMVQKQSLSVSASNVLFLRLVRVKTSEEQGLSLYPDHDDFMTCPIHALALALLMQASPCAPLLDQVPRQPERSEPFVGVHVSLLEMLSNGSAADEIGISAESGSKKPSSPREPGIHSYVNRILKQNSKLAGVESELTSHSFRRGGAQRANGDHQLSAQWIFDRGVWNLPTTNKTFAYVFNTTNEDQKIARVLSGWKASNPVPIAALAGFDSQTVEKIRGLQALLFATCFNQKNPRLAVNARVLDACTAYLLRNFPLLRELDAEFPAVKRVEECCIEAGLHLSDLMAWSIELQTPQVDAESLVPAANAHTNNHTDQAARDQAMIKHQEAVINGLIEISKRWKERLEALESATKKRKAESGCVPATKYSQQEEDSQLMKPKKKKKKTATTHLNTVWYECYTRRPRVWDSDVCRQKKSSSKKTVAFMKLFLAEGFVIDESADTFEATVRSYGLHAEALVTGFLKARGIDAVGAESVLGHMRTAHSEGLLNDMTRAYKALRATGAIVDPSPLKSQDALEIIQVK